MKHRDSQKVVAIRSRCHLLVFHKERVKFVPNMYFTLNDARRNKCELNHFVGWLLYLIFAIGWIEAIKRGISSMMCTRLAESSSRLYWCSNRIVVLELTLNSVVSRTENKSDRAWSSSKATRHVQQHFLSIFPWHQFENSTNNGIQVRAMSPRSCSTTIHLADGLVFFKVCS